MTKQFKKSALAGLEVEGSRSSETLAPIYQLAWDEPASAFFYHSTLLSYFLVQGPDPYPINMGGTSQKFKNSTGGETIIKMDLLLSVGIPFLDGLGQTHTTSMFMVGENILCLYLNASGCDCIVLST
jgi:hypothetical protein